MDIYYYSLIEYMNPNSFSRLACIVETNNYTFFENIIHFLKQQTSYHIKFYVFPL